MSTQMGETPELGENLFSGRRSFDRQMEMLTIAVHTLQRDFGVLNERVASLQERMATFSQSVSDMEQALHSMDKTLIARVATIKVGERVLWLVVVALIGLGAKFFGH